MSGLTRKKIKVRSKSGKTYQRSVLVRAGEKVGRFVNKHKGKIAIAAGAAVVGGLALASHMAHKRRVSDAIRTAAASHVQGSVRHAAKAATQNIRMNVEYVKAARDKMREDISHIERRTENLRNQINAKLHGQHDISPQRKARDAVQAQSIRSSVGQDMADRKRSDSAARSGHFTSWTSVRFGKFGGHTSQVPTHRLESGTSAPQPKKSRSSGRKRS